MLLTGANASGKSIYARQLGLILYLAHVGMLVPARLAYLPLLDCLLCMEVNASASR
jgi:DNA mismatch repair protein MSH5